MFQKIRHLLIVFPLTLALFACSSRDKTPQQPVVQSSQPAGLADAHTNEVLVTADILTQASATPTPITESALPTATLLPTEGIPEPTATVESSPSPAENQSEPPAAPSETPTSAVTPTQPPPSTEPVGGQAECLDEVGFDSDVTIPDNTLLKSRESFIKTWRVKNTGTCPWAEGYSLVYASGELMNGLLSNPIPMVAPGAYVDISIELTAPERGGQHTSYWEFQNPAGVRFGVGSGGHDKLWAQIIVDWSTPGGGEVAPTQPISADCGVGRDSAGENQVLEMINSARATAGLAPLSVSSQLSAAAVQHSTDMACNNLTNHTGSDGSTWYDRAAAQGYANYSSARENIYYGGFPADAFEWWMNSQVHYDNIMHPNVSEIGLGFVTYDNSAWVRYFTLVFARP